MGATWASTRPTSTGRCTCTCLPAPIPKDGPSAGVTMVTALASLATGRAVRSDVGMTGEVTLNGRVLPIGGVKQKLLAAHRAGLTTVFLPQRNEPDLDDVPAGGARAARRPAGRGCRGPRARGADAGGRAGAGGLTPHRSVGVTLRGGAHARRRARRTRLRTPDRTAHRS